MADYKNYRCRKCGKYIAIYDDKYLRDSATHLIVSKKTHSHCSAGLADDESAVTDFVSVSKSLIDGVVDVIDRFPASNQEQQSVSQIIASNPQPETREVKEGLFTE